MNINFNVSDSQYFDCKGRIILNIEELKEWSQENDIEKRTKDGFWKTLNNYQLESPKEYQNVFGNIKIEHICLEVNTISLNLDNWPECNYITVGTYMPIIYSLIDRDKCLGDYKMLFNLDGSIEDVIFRIYQSD